MGLAQRRNLILVVIFGLAGIYVVLLSLGDSIDRRPWMLKNEPQKETSGLVRAKLKDPLRFTRSKRTRCDDRLNKRVDNTFYAIRTTSDKLWNYIPLQISSTIKRFPRHAIYCDSGAVIGSMDVIDIVSTYDMEAIRQNPNLAGYEIRRHGIDHDWGWAAADYPSPNTQKVEEIMTHPIVVDIRQKAPMSTEWFILAHESSYVSAGAFTQFVSGLSQDTPLIYTWGSEGQVPNMLWNRAAYNAVTNNEIEPFRTNLASGNISSTLLNDANWCEPLVFFHDLAPWEIQTLHDRELSSESSITHADFYRDFLLPFVKAERPNWELNPSGLRVNGDHENLQPHKEKRHCKRLCETNPKCLAWQWEENRECYLETDSSIRRGFARNTQLVGVTDDTPLVTSGYMLDRIRLLRNATQCDPLTISGPPLKEASDTESTSEGWLFNLKAQLELEESDVLQAMNDYNNQIDEPSNSQSE